MVEAEIERLDQLLKQHVNGIKETYNVFYQSPLSSQTKVSCDEVVKLGEELYKQATAVGTLWTGEGPDAKALEESMEIYSNLLQRFILLSHGSLIGAVSALYSEFHANVKAVMESSITLLENLVASYGDSSKAQLLIPQIVDNVCKACSSLKETPRTNIAAVSGAMTQIAHNISDILQEMKELKASSHPSDEVSKPDNDNNDNENSGGDYGSDLSPRGMRNNDLAIEVVSGTLSTIKETIRSITSLDKNPQTHDENIQMMVALEDLEFIWDSMERLVDRITYYLYESDGIKHVRTASEEMVSCVGELQEQMELISGSSVDFVDVSNDLKSSLKQLELGLESSDDDDDDDGDDDDDDDDDNDDKDDDEGYDDDGLVSEIKNLEIDFSCD